MLICRFGRYCLEVGRKAEAMELFKQVQDMVVEMKSRLGATGQVDKSETASDPLSGDALSQLGIES